MNKLIAKRKDKIVQRNILIWGSLAFFTLFVSLVGYAIFSAAKFVGSANQIIPATPIILQPTITAIPTDMPENINLMHPLQHETGPPPRPWDGESRVNLLFLGGASLDLDSDPSNQQIDSILLVSVDPPNRRAGLLSIPRDLWVEIPGFGYHPIGQTYQIGAANNVSSGGAGLVIRTLENLFDIPISFYTLIDYPTFSFLIDEIEGVKTDVSAAISVDPLGDHNTTMLKPGVQTLPGELALAYVRALPEDGNDFTRMQRQQHILLQIPKRIVEFDIFARLVERAPAVYREISSGMATNLNLEQILQFTWLATRISEENITLEMIGPGQVTLSTTADGETLLRPIPEEIFTLRDSFFYDKTPIGPSLGDPLANSAIQSENASIDLRNGTQTPGLGVRTEAYLVELGFIIATVSNAEKIYANSVIIDYAGKPYSVQQLAKTLNITDENIFYRLESDRAADILILLGSDWAANNTLP